MGWRGNKLKIKVYQILLITITTLFTSLICISEAKLVSVNTSLEESSKEATHGLVDKKKVSFTSEKAVPKIFGSIPLPWPFNITNPQLPNQNPGGFTTGSGSTNVDPGNFGGSFGTLGTSAVLIKGGFLTLLTALKAVIIPPLLLILLIAFLVAGAAFFTCSIVDCSAALGGLGGGGSSVGGIPNPLNSFTNPFNRNTYELYDQARPVYQALEDGYKNYGTYHQDYSGSGSSGATNSKTK